MAWLLKIFLKRFRKIWTGLIAVDATTAGNYNGKRRWGGHCSLGFREDAMMESKAWLFAAAALLLASLPLPVEGADEIPTLRIRGDGWTIQQLDSKSEKDKWHNATIRLVL
jgi:hypothetical protein